MRHDDGTLRAWWNELGLDKHRSEWQKLATAEPLALVSPALLSKKHTPGLWACFERVFLAMVHATRNEAAVSKQKSLEDSHMTGTQDAA